MKIVTRTFNIFCLLSLSACATNATGFGETHRSSSSAPDLNSTSSTTETTQLRKVWVPGSTRNTYDPPNRQVDPLLDPQMPPPAFSESKEIALNCSPNSLANVRDESGNVLIDRSEFDQIMKFGREVAQARQVWSFEQRRFEHQRDVVNGWAQRMGPAEFERLRREDAEYQRWRDQIRAARDAGKTDNQTRQMLMRMAPKRPHTAAHLIPRSIDDLQFNRSILAAQDEEIKQREAIYGERLVALYAASVKAFASIPLQNISLRTLNGFDSARDGNIHSCMARTGLAPRSAAANDVINAEYLPIARATISNNRSNAIASLQKTQSSKEFSDMFISLFSTQLLRDLVQEDAELAQKAGSHHKRLLAKEESAREEVRKRIAAAEKRQQALQKAELRRKAENNVPPTIADIAKLFTTRSIALSEKNYVRIERTGDDSFELHNALYKTSDVTMNISDLVCSPKIKKQHCSFSAVPRYSDPILFGLLGQKVSEGSSFEYKADFYWTDSGLNSDDLRGTQLYSETVNLGKSSSAGSSDDMKAENQRLLETLRQRTFSRIEDKRKGND